MASQPRAQGQSCLAGFRFIASAMVCPPLAARTPTAHAQWAVQKMATVRGNGHWYQRVTGPGEACWL
jgi:hypothetical protein